MLAEVLLGLRALREAVAGQDEGEHDASLGASGRGTMAAGGTNEKPMSDHDATPAQHAATTPPDDGTTTATPAVTTITARRWARWARSTGACGASASWASSPR